MKNITCPHKACGVIHDVQKIRRSGLTWNADVNTVFLVKISTVAALTSLASSSSV